eukprot:3337543-Prymnesium_polylepis.2
MRRLQRAAQPLLAGGARVLARGRRERRELHLELGDPHDRLRLDLDALYDVVLRAGREQQQARLVRVDAPRDGVRRSLDELESRALREDQVELDARRRHHHEVRHRLARPLVRQDPEAALGAAALALVHKVVAEQQVDKLDLDVGALHRRQPVVEREAHILYLAAHVAPDGRVPVHGGGDEFAVLDEYKPTRGLVEAQLVVLLVKFEHGRDLDVHDCGERRSCARRRGGEAARRRGGERRTHRADQAVSDTRVATCTSPQVRRVTHTHTSTRGWMADGRCCRQR